MSKEFFTWLWVACILVGLAFRTHLFVAQTSDYVRIPLNPRSGLRRIVAKGVIISGVFAFTILLLLLIEVLLVITFPVSPDQSGLVTVLKYVVFFAIPVLASVQAIFESGVRRQIDRYSQENRQGRRNNDPAFE